MSRFRQLTNHLAVVAERGCDSVLEYRAGLGGLALLARVLPIVFETSTTAPLLSVIRVSDEDAADPTADAEATAAEGTESAALQDSASNAVAAASSADDAAQPPGTLWQSLETALVDSVLQMGFCPGLSCGDEVFADAKDDTVDVMRGIWCAV
jgi:hypothetical protein